MPSPWSKEAQRIDYPYQVWQDNPGPGLHFGLPIGIMVVRATPPRRGLTVNCEVKRLTLSDGAPASKNPGSLSPPAPLSCGAPLRRAKRGHRCAASLRFVAPDAGNPCCPTSDAAFRESLQPQRRGVRPLRKRRCGGIAIMKRLGEHRCFLPVSPIRRHLLDPQRRKSSIIRRPSNAGVSCSSCLIFLRAPCRSTVSQSASEMACPRTAASVLAPPGSRVVQARRTRRARRSWSR